MKKTLCVIFTILLGSCSLTKSTQQHKYAKKHSFAKQQLKLGRTRTACTIFMNQSKKEDFHLHKLSFIRSLEACQKYISNQTLISHWDQFLNKTSAYPSWLRQEYLKTSLRLARKRRLKKYMASFLFHLSDFEKLKKSKAAIIKEAIKLDDNPLFEEKLLKISPRFNTEITDQNRYKVARDFEHDLQFKKARSLYREIIQSSSKDYIFPDKLKAWKKVCLTYKKERKMEAYIDNLRKMSHWIKKRIKLKENIKYQKHRYQSEIKLARAIWTENRPTEASGILKILLKNKSLDPKSRVIAHRTLGGIAQEAKELDQSLFHYKNATNTELPREEQSLKEDINWKIGWVHYLKNDFKKTAVHFEEMKRKTDNFFLIPKLEYWEAKARKEIGQNDKAEEIFLRLCDNHPYNYYGILAHLELGRPFTPVDKNFNSYNTHIKLPILELLLEANEKNIAKKYLDFKAAQGYKKEYLLKLLPMFKRVNHFDKGIATFYRLPPETRSEILNKNIPLVFPQGYNKTIRNIALKFQIEEEFLYSIIRQESAFNVASRSPADAYGLMQITPQTARRLSKRYKIKNFTNVQDLYRKRMNILMGTTLLKELKEEFKNHFTATVASYNADYRKVKNWIKGRFDGNHIKFIEMIPYSETRNYVKLVLRNYIIYKRLSAKKEFYFPEHLFPELDGHQI